MSMSSALTSPLFLLLEGVHCQRREQVDEAMRQLQTVLSQSACSSPSYKQRGLSEAVRLLMTHHPELASTVSPEDRSLSLHHADALGEAAVAQHLLAKVRALAVFKYLSAHKRL
jgi:hypothetical protein